mmetsp:Transcript_9859/g.19686  ORF Transcript_9859/g.19686 Transcript_9859/m.19686 type:complete len:379 (+) Transcript_9859:234-1370(+)|eukprot:CAMPEP_0181309286 /NCGR_PEP_ID=MMETSP1101-20121128/11933_1 /TAXON_ID=46948 /ORGANISM="Rhodomonas abbreviata, Strain Caron Lab Isolate" /LENGTH=378 /DNA_ID=CAMNT_0023415761 /DNA_START=232 /DNA_END=1368 /DNA_ORIENTATION=-
MQQQRRQYYCTLLALFTFTTLSGFEAAEFVGCSKDEMCGVEDPTINKYGSYNYNDDGKIISKGFCDQENDECICTHPYVGDFCTLRSQAAGPQISDSLQVNGWKFLAKSCWAGETTGSLRVTMTWKSITCDDNAFCYIGDHPDGVFPPESMPNIYFYASFDPAFEEAVLASYKASFGEVSVDHKHCSGSDAVLSRRTSCRMVEGSNSTCHYSDTFRVVNRAEQPTLVYVVVGGCGLNGVVDWEIEVEVEDGDRKKRPSVCGSSKTVLEHMCLSEAGGSCALQRRDTLETSFKPKQKLSRIVVAILAVCFVSVVLLGLGAIKYYQAKHKAARARTMLRKMGVQSKMPENGEGGEGTTYQGIGNTQQHFTISGVSSSMGP